MAIGGVTPFGLPRGLPIFVDAAVMDRRRIILGGGSRNLKVAGPPALLCALPDVEIVFVPVIEPVDELVNDRYPPPLPPPSPL